VPPELLPRANGLMQTMWSLSTILSPAIAAAILVIPAMARQGVLGPTLGTALGGLVSGAPLATAVDAITFFAAAAVLPFLNIPSPRRREADSAAAKAKSLTADVMEGARYIWYRRSFIWLLGVFALSNFVGPFLHVLQPILLKFRLAADWSSRGYMFETAMALLATAGSVGGMAGGLFVSAWGGLKKRRVLGVIVPMCIWMIAAAAYGVSTKLYVSAASIALLASMSPIMNAHSQTIWQTQTPVELQGRVFAVRRLIAQFTAPLSTAIAGFTSGRFDPTHVIVAVTTFGALFTFAQLVNPAILRIEDREFIENLARERQARAESEPR